MARSLFGCFRCDRNRSCVYNRGCLPAQVQPPENISQEGAHPVLP